MAKSAKGAGKGKKGMSKLGAVRRALAALGKEAKPSALQVYVKEKFGIAMQNDQVGNYKGKLLRGEVGKKPAAKAAPTAAKPAGHANGSKSGIGLGDIEKVKGLVGRVGAPQLRSLIDLLAK
jgi:hypothetical protein